MPNLVIVGASGHGKCVREAARLDFDVCGILDDSTPAGTIVDGVQVLGPVGAPVDATLKGLQVTHVVIAIGDNHLRSLVAKKVLAFWPEAQFATIVHPSAVVADSAVLGPGTVVMPNAVLQPNCKVGQHCIINTKASVDHDSTMGDYSSLAPGSTVCGRVTIGEFTAIGPGATVIQGISIGSQTVIGAGSTVVRHVPDNVVAFGCPARPVRDRKAGDKYM